jgi:hypothetical protein
VTSGYRIGSPGGLPYLNATVRVDQCAARCLGTSEVRILARSGLRGSGQPKGVRYALRRLLRVWTVKYLGTADTLLNVRDVTNV